MKYPDRTSFRGMQVLGLGGSSIRDGIIWISSCVYVFDCPPLLVEGWVGGKETNPLGLISLVIHSRISRISAEISKSHTLRFGIWFGNHNGHAHWTRYLSEWDKEMRRGVPEWGVNTSDEVKDTSLLYEVIPGCYCASAAASKHRQPFQLCLHSVAVTQVGGVL